MKLKGKKIVVVGLGKTGWDVANFLLGREAEVYVTEKNENALIFEKAGDLEKHGCKVEIGKHTEKFLKGASFLIPCPGVSGNSVPVRWAKENNVPLYSEIELAYLFSSSKKIIAITGTNGKTTTASLTGFLFKNAGLPYILCGNIGNTFISEIEKITADTRIVVEVSSFQLEYINVFKPFIGVLLNITPDHLDRYFSMDEYVYAKEKLFKNQSGNDWAILNFDDSLCRQISKSLKANKCFFSSLNYLDGGIFLVENNKIISDFSRKGEFCSIEKSRLSGAGNIQNMLAVSAVAMISDIKREVVEKTFENFNSLPHRFEKVVSVSEIMFINDSKATNVDSVKKALESFPDEKKIVLIMGGKDKEFSFFELVPLVEKKVKCLILLGETKGKIASELKKSGVKIKFVADMKEAVISGYREGEKGDIVLLSPGCSSFDMFQDYKERGIVFKDAVKTLL